MGEDFFFEVERTDPLRRARVDDPLSFKVYEPDRLVLGKRMEDHLRIGVCFWHSFAWAGTDMFGSGTFDRPWIGEPCDPMAAARMKMAAAFEFFTKLGVPLLLLPRPRRRARRAAASPSSGRTSTPSPMTRPATRSGPASASCGAPRTSSATRATGRRRDEPRPGGLRLRRGAGEEHARGDPAPRRRELRPVGRPRGLRHAPQHRPAPRGSSSSPASCTSSPSTSTRSASRARSSSSPSRWSRPSTSTTSTPRPSTASSPATGSRASTASTSRRTTPRSRATASTTRSPTPSRTACSAASTRTAATPRTAGTPTSSRTRSRSCRLAALRDPARPAASRPAASTSTPSCAARACDRTDLFHAHIGGIDTLARALLVAADMLEKGTLARMVEERYAGWSGELGAAILRRLGEPGGPGGEGGGGRDRPATRSPAARSCSRTSSTSTSGRWTAAAPAADATRTARPGPTDERRTRGTTMGHVLGIDASTTAVKAILVDESGTVRGVGSAAYDLSVPRPLWSEQDPRLWWDGTVDRDPRRPGRDRHPGRRRRRRRPDRPDARRRPPRRGGRGAPAGDPVERPADRRRVRPDPRGRRARSASSRSRATTP